MFYVEKCIFYVKKRMFYDVKCTFYDVKHNFPAYPDFFPREWNVLFKVVLSFALGGRAKVDCILGAAVVATHAVGAMTVPLGAVILYCNVLERAVFGADAASYA